MGMFDYVVMPPDYECPYCGAVGLEFQSKSGLCVLDTTEFTHFNEFHTSCPSCGEWVQYVRRNAEPPTMKTLREQYMLVGDDDDDL